LGKTSRVGLTRNFGDIQMKNLKKTLAAASLGTVAVLSVPSAFALDAAITTALTSVGTDVGLLGAAIVIVCVAILGFKLLKKAL
jgi:Inovirus Coat protein B